jgi:hypothetical protein
MDPESLANQNGGLNEKEAFIHNPTPAVKYQNGSVQQQQQPRSSTGCCG